MRIQWLYFQYAYLHIFGMPATAHLTRKDEATIARDRTKSLGLSQQNLAAVFGIEQSQVSRLLSLGFQA